MKGAELLQRNSKIASKCDIFAHNRDLLCRVAFTSGPALACRHTMSVASLVARLLPPLWRRWFLAVGVLALLLLVGAHVGQAYQQRVGTYRHQVETALRAVSQLQATNIADWRVRHLGDAADLSSDPLLMHAVARWLAAPTPEQTTALQERLRSLEENLRYTAAFFVDQQGMVRLDSASRGQSQGSPLLLGPLEPPEAQALHRALERAQPVGVELHRSAAFAFPFFGVLAPLYGPDNAPLGAIWLVLHAQARLGPLLETLPNSTPSAESLLLRRDGPWVQYLITPRLHDTDAPDVRQILDEAPEDVAVQAAYGERGIMHGVDYRGKAVLAFASTVRDTPWILVAKVDQEDVLAQAQRNEWMGMALLASLLLLLGGSAFAGWQWQARRREQALKNELQYSLQWLDSAQKAARMGYFAYYARDEEFFMSSMACAIFGLPPQERMTLQQWIAMLHPQERAEVLKIHRQAMQQRSPLHAQYRIARSNDAQERWVQVWGEYAMDPHQNTLRMTGTVQDITERRQSEEQLDRYRHTLEEQVRLDPLTQLANRRALDEALQTAWAQAQERRRPLALLMLDIDHFKAYNDHYGHVGGDHCLQQVAAALAAAVQRQGELVARYGGEEFAVLLPDADSAQALATAQRLCAAVRALELEHQTSPVRRCVTVSVGATCLYPENSAATPGISQLFEQADAALYQAKKAGRDRAELWTATAQSITLRRS